MDGVQNEAFEASEKVEIEMESHVEELSRLSTGEDSLTPNSTALALKRPAVTVRGAYKSYGKSSHILKNFNMTVTEGTIYSLLGSSGCGKTTILSAIVGIKSLDKGEIRVFGQKTGSPESGIPGRCVGHMPQEYALYSEFSVEESLQYYGYIYGMTKSQIKTRSEFLIKFLNLPKPTQKIGTLSGGQKRRVSLAIALCHEPRLLILDEPTVGVDHLLRESIWEQLRSLVANGKTTVIITTHYIEESRGSDTIGLMRNGRLLTEKNPLELLKEHNNATFLEDVVLNLSRYDAEIDTCEDKNQNPQNVNESETILATPAYINDPKQSADAEKYRSVPFSFSRLYSLINKNAIILFRNFLFLIFNFFSPSLQIVVVCLAIGTLPQHLRFGVVNNETSVDCKSYHLPPLGDSGCTPLNWSCEFINSLPKNDLMELVSYTTDEEALKDVEKGYIWGYMSFPSNFSVDLFNRMVGGPHPTNESLLGSTITFQMDMSSQTIGSVLERTAYTTFPIFAASVLESCDFEPRVGEMPIKFKEPVYGSVDTAFREFLAPSILLGLLFFFPLCGSGIVYITEKKAGTLDRSLVAGVTTLEVMLSNLVTQTFVLLVQTGFAFTMLTQVFGIPIKGSVVGALSIAILIGIAGMSMGFLIATFCHEEIHAVLLAIGTFFPNFLLAGMVWPIEGMPLLLRYVGYLLPCTLACESIRSIISRGWSIFHYRVWPGFASTIAWICVYWILTIFIHKKFQGKK